MCCSHAGRATQSLRTPPVRSVPARRHTLLQSLRQDHPRSAWFHVPTALSNTSFSFPLPGANTHPPKYIRHACSILGVLILAVNSGRRSIDTGSVWSDKTPSAGRACGRLRPPYTWASGTAMGGGGTGGAWAREANSHASRMASFMLPGSAWLVPAISKAVP